MSNLLVGLFGGGGGSGGGGSGGTGTADIIIDELGVNSDTITLTTDLFWLGTGITVPESVHGILLDLSPATDDYHFVDWDTIRGDEAGVVGELSVAAQYETFVAQSTTGIGHIIRIGHDDAGQILLADDSGSGINIDFLRVERILVPASTIGATLQYGSGVPANTLGSNGDSYLDVDTGIFYLRASGTYASQYTDQMGAAGEPVEDLFDEHEDDGVPEENVTALSTSIGTTNTVFVVDSVPTSTIAAGDFIQVNDEIMYVIGYTVATMTLSIKRGVLGTVAGIHLVGTEVDLLDIADGRTIAAQTFAWDSDSNNNIFDLGRVLTAEDDDKILWISIEYFSSDSGGHLFESKPIPVDLFRRFRSHSLTIDDITDTLPIIIPRQNRSDLSSGGEATIHIGRHRLTADDETNNRGIEGDDSIILALSSTNTTSLTRFQVHIFLSDLGGGSASTESGQQSEDSAGTTTIGNGRVSYTLYQAVSTDTTPAEPVNPHDGTSLVTDFGDWAYSLKEVIDAAGTNDYIWSSQGGYTYDSTDSSYTNWDWALRVTSYAQYATDFTNNDTYTLTIPSAEPYFYRFRFPDLGYSGWYTNNGSLVVNWVTLFSEERVYSTTSGASTEIDIDPVFNAGPYDKMRITMVNIPNDIVNYPLGPWGQVTLDKPGDDWTTIFSDASSPIIGAYKLRNDFRDGLDALQVRSTSGGTGSYRLGPDDNFAHSTGPDYAPRRSSYVMFLINTADSDGDMINLVRFSDFGGTYGRTILTVEFA